MKKIIAILLTLCFLLTACADGSVLIPNRISPKTLSKDQREIIDLLSDNSQELLLFDFKTADSYNTVKFWVDCYEHGELVNSVPGIEFYSDEAEKQSGTLAVTVHNANDTVRFGFKISTDGTRISNPGETLSLSREALACAYGPINYTAGLGAGSETALYTAIYSAGSITSYSDMQRYIDEPELLKPYPYAYIIKCRFN